VRKTEDDEAGNEDEVGDAKQFAAAKPVDGVADARPEQTRDDKCKG